jgi:4-azaleucine resistance transporter AzlC
MESGMMVNFRKGAVDILPLAVSAMIYGGVLGVLSGQKGVSWAEMLAMDLFMFAGSAQFVMVNMWSSPLPVIEIGMAVLAINLRYLLIGASLRDVFSGYGLKAKALVMHWVVDENWAITMARHRSIGADPFYLLGSGLLLMLAWSSATVMGNVMGGFILEPEKYALDFAFVAVFAALGLSLWRGRTDLIPWCTAGILAAAAEQVFPGKWYIVIGGLAGALTAAFWRSPSADGKGDPASQEA